MPSASVNQTRLATEYAVPTASLALELQTGGNPGFPKGSWTYADVLSGGVRLALISLMDTRRAKRLQCRTHNFAVDAEDCPLAIFAMSDFQFELSVFGGSEKKRAKPLIEAGRHFKHTLIGVDSDCLPCCIEHDRAAPAALKMALDLFPQIRIYIVIDVIRQFL